MVGQGHSTTPTWAALYTTPKDLCLIGPRITPEHVNNVPIAISIVIDSSALKRVGVGHTHWIHLLSKTPTTDLRMRMSLAVR